MTGDFHYQLSRRSTKFLIESLKCQKDFAYNIYIDTIIFAHDELFKIKGHRLEETFTATIRELNKMQQRAMKRAKDCKIFLWFNVIPTSQHQYDLSAQQFCDALAIWYQKPLLNIPAHCDGCGSPFHLSHAVREALLFSVTMRSDTLLVILPLLFGGRFFWN
uniref:Uncharacterized protein n=1 Tax=Amphimedon queenslandica TaxID=400682 RepID=A0A1X7V657_AMPQE